MNTTLERTHAIGDTPERRFAVRQRDKTQDGEFVYAVRTTGVYCRPSCPSRPAREENVEFFATTDAAKAAGYRACKRCRPDEASLDSRRREIVMQACRTLEQSPAPVALDALARAAGMTPQHFQRIFKATLGVTPKVYAQGLRAQRAQRALARAATVTEAIYDAGFNSSSRFYEDEAASPGMAPRDALAGGTGQRIRYAAEPCALGVVLVAATPKGVCAIEFGSSAHALVERLRERFPNAAFEPGDASFRGWVGRVLEQVERPQGALDLPLDVQGTAFQRQVWQALRAIPSGQTKSYSEVAAAIGRPKAVRAVAAACAGNRIAVAIPCHRVVRADGSVAGYRWGTERKVELLRREQKAALERS